jgi:hypothetical protein
MATTVVTVIEALQMIQQLVPLVQSAVAAGSAHVDPVAFDRIVNARNAALDKLDADIATVNADIAAARPARAKTP